MNGGAHYDLAFWQVHETENDCDLVIRSTSGRVFYCHIDPVQFVQSPAITDRYFKCLAILRSGEVEIDDFYEEDAYEWLLECFKPLISRPFPASEPRFIAQPTLTDYFLPREFHVCTLDALEDKLQPKELDTKHHGWSSPIVKVDEAFLAELDEWTRRFPSSDVTLCYDEMEDTLVKPPKRVTVTGLDGRPLACFFKRFGLSFGPAHAKKELATLKQIVQGKVPPPPEAYVCRLLGVVQEGSGLLGMVFAWIENKGVLSRARASMCTIELRKCWASQISRSLRTLHDSGIIWGDAKPENILIDQNDDAWIIDFGGSYTLGWVDKEKAETLEGDEQGVTRILDILK